MKDDLDGHRLAAFGSHGGREAQATTHVKHITRRALVELRATRNVLELR